MKRRITPLKVFSKNINKLIAQHKLDFDDYEDFKKELVENPTLGDTVSGTGGVRKTRLKYPSKGKSGGFRVCYFYEESEEIFLILIYPKNEQEDLTSQQKKDLKAIVSAIKREK